MESKFLQSNEIGKKFINIEENNPSNQDNIKDTNEKIIKENEELNKIDLEEKKEMNKKLVTKNNSHNEKDETNVEVFYERGKDYWKNVEASVDGMLGGLGHVSGIDIAESCRFLKQFIKSPVANTKNNCALDCGAGIGRVTKKLLLPLFKSVDMVEVSQHFLDKAPSYIGDESCRVGNYFCSGLQDFTPASGKYDVIWCQWVLGHLTDEDLVDFFKRCKAGLSSSGLICFKENVSGNSELDQSDSSYTRTRNHFIDLVTLAGLEVVKETKQKSFPSELYQVRMFAIS